MAGRKRGNRLAGQWQASIEREMGGGTDRSCLTKKGKLGSLLDRQWVLCCFMFYTLLENDCPFEVQKARVALAY